MPHTNEPQPLKVGIAGLGQFGKLHAAVLSRLPGAQLVAACDPDLDHLATVADQHGIPGRYADLDQMLAQADLDALFLVTPEQTHAELAMLAIARGLPLFLEKPLATSATEGQAIAAAAQRAGVPLQVGFVLRFETRHALLKAEVDAGRCGRLISIRAKRNCSRDWIDLYGDRAHAVFETVIHDIDLMLWLTGSRCQTVYAVSRNLSGHRFPDATFALLQFADGTVGMLETSWSVPPGAPGNVLTAEWHGTIDAALEVVGTEQTAHLRALEAGLSIWSPAIVKQPEPSLWPEVHGAIAGALREEDAHFLDCVRAGTPSPIASVADAVEGLRIAEAIVESAERGREVSLA